MEKYSKIKFLLSLAMVLAIFMIGCTNDEFDPYDYISKTNNVGNSADIITTGSSSDVTYDSATVSVTLNENYRKNHESAYVGVYYSSTDKSAGSGSSVKYIRINSLTSNVAKIQFTELSEKTTYYYRAVVLDSYLEVIAKAVEVKTFTTKAMPDYLDLGLSVKWATRNLGAKTPFDSGDYYEYGQTDLNIPTKTYSRSLNYLVANGILTSTYNLKPEYDAARVNLGNPWRMPTKEEWQELINKCTWEEINNSGYKITGANGNYIYLPIAGSRFNHDWTYVWESHGAFYWTSTCCDTSVTAYGMTDFWHILEIWTPNRKNQMPIRAVRD